MQAFTVGVQLHDDGAATLEWAGEPSSWEQMVDAFSLATKDAFSRSGIRRLSVVVPEFQSDVIRAVHRLGFLREGRLREACRDSSGGLADAFLYARLASDAEPGLHGFSAVMNTVLPTKRVMSHVIFTNTQGEVLLIETTYKDDWELPGGVLEPHETPREGAQREVREEIGLRVDLGAPALVDYMPSWLGWSDALGFIFLARPLTPAECASVTACDPREVRALHWVPPDELEHITSPVAARRIQLVLRGFRGMTEQGLPMTEPSEL